MTEKKSGKIGKTIATIGVSAIAISFVLGLVFRIPGATLHNVLQLGGLALGVVGVILWRFVKI